MNIIERNRLLFHVLDASGIEGRDAREDFEIINKELQSYSEALSNKEQVIILNKTDLVYEKEQINELKAYFEDKGYKVFIICAATGEGVRDALNYAGTRLESIPVPELYSEENMYREELDIREDKPFEVYVADDGVVTAEGPFIDKLMDNTNPYDYESMQYFQRALKTKGVIEEMEKLGVKEGDTVRLAEMEFEFVL